MRIAYFANTTVWGGVEEHIATLINGIDRGRYEPFFVGSRQNAAKMKTIVDLPEERFLSLEKTPRISVGLVGAVGRFLRNNKIDLLNTHLFISTLSGVPAARVAGVPRVIETAHLRETWREGRWSDNYLVDRLVYRGVDGIIAVSRGCAEFLQEKKKVSSDKITVIWNGRDLARFDGTKFDRNEVRRELGFGSGEYLFGTLGRLEPQKNHHLLLEASKIARERGGRPFKVVILGEGFLRESLEKKAAELDITGEVLFPGFKTDSEKWLAALDCFILSSDYEGFPLSLIEAGAMGLPVISTLVDGADEIIEDGKSGFLVPVKDPAALAEKMLSFSGIASRRRRRASASPPL